MERNQDASSTLIREEIVVPERDAKWSRAAQVGMLMRAYRETFPLGNGRYGLTQASLLERMSEVNGQYAERYSHVTVSRWESGSTLPTLNRLQDFGDALNLAPTEVRGLLALAGFREAAGGNGDRKFTDWTDTAVEEGSDLEPQPVPMSNGEYASSAGDGRSAVDTTPGSLVPDMGSIIRYLSYKCVLTGVCIAVGGYALAAFGWNNTWMPMLYVAAAMCLVVSQGLLHRRSPHDLGEFYSTAVFFLLSTFLLQSAVVRMDPYGFYTFNDYAGTHIPFLLALEVNLALASVAGLAFHLLRQWQYSRDQGRTNGLRRAVAVTLPPTLFTYVAIVILSNISLWIQLIMVLPPLAGAFVVLLVLRDTEVRPNARDRRFSLVTVVVVVAVMGTVGAAVVAAIYLAPNTPSVLPDHNWWTSWEVDFGQLGYPQEEALERLNRGYLWHGLATFFYMVLVVGGVVIASIYRIGKDDGAMAAAPGSVPTKSVYQRVPAWTRRVGSAFSPRLNANDAGTGRIRAVTKLMTARKSRDSRLAGGNSTRA